MLWVYAGLDIIKLQERIRKDIPSEYIDFSKLATEDLSKAVNDYCDHHSGGHMYLGYLDPLLMLHPIQETLLRRGFAQCTVSILVSNPYLLPLSWKNGIGKLVVLETVNGTLNSQTLDNGGLAHIQDEAEHRYASKPASDKRVPNKGRKKRGPAKG